MTTAETAKPVNLDPQDHAEERNSPLRDSLRLFRRNKAAVVSLVIILSFFLMALTASLWTEVGLIDQRSGFDTFHEINPVGLERVDAFADPMTCAREGLRTAEAWCSLLTEEEQARYPAQCSGASAAAATPDKQWCFVFGSDRVGRDWFTQLVYGSQVSIAVAMLGTSVSLIIGLVLRHDFRLLRRSC